MPVRLDVDQLRVHAHPFTGAPGMVGGLLRHLQSLRQIRDDRGWISELLDEAENGRMHLMTFVQIAQPTRLERYVIIVTSLSHDFDPANWAGVYQPTWVEAAITIGSFGLFFTLFLLFIKNFPALSMTEMKETMDRKSEADPAASWPEPV